MAGGAGGPDDRSLEETPTWAVALVCFAFILISLALEMLIHKLSHWFASRNKKALFEALEKLKAELMILGFISLLLTVAQEPISKICIPKRIGSTMLPCAKNTATEKAETGDKNQHRRRLLSEFLSSHSELGMLWRRELAGAGGGDYCYKQGKYPLVSQSGMHQLHIFIFVLAILHVAFSVLIIILGRAKMSRWKVWEKDTQTMEFQFSNDPERIRLAEDISFVQHHSSCCGRIFIFNIIGCFFRQFYAGVTRTDYLTLRHGFIMAHFAPNTKFDFQKYIKRSLEKDFQTVVGISPILWGFAIVFLLVNVYGWYAFFWLSFIPLVIILIVGTKLQYIISEMASEIQQKQIIVKGLPVVKPSDEWFWFRRPKLVLWMIHFTMFENAFQLAYVLWIWYHFGLKSCFHAKFSLVIVKIVLGLVLQFICSYITLPLYALVTQMGSHMTTAIFEEGTADAVKRWRHKGKKNKMPAGKSEHSTSRYGSKSFLGSSNFASGASTPESGSSPMHLLHRYKTMEDIESSMTVMSERDYAMNDSPFDSPEAGVITPFSMRAQQMIEVTRLHQDSDSNSGRDNKEGHSFVFDVK